MAVGLKGPLVENVETFYHQHGTQQRSSRTSNTAVPLNETRTSSAFKLYCIPAAEMCEDAKLSLHVHNIYVQFLNSNESDCAVCSSINTTTDCFTVIYKEYLTAF